MVGEVEREGAGKDLRVCVRVRVRVIACGCACVHARMCGRIW